MNDALIALVLIALGVVVLCAGVFVLAGVAVGLIVLGALCTVAGVALGKGWL